MKRDQHQKDDAERDKGGPDDSGHFRVPRFQGSGCTEADARTAPGRLRVAREAECENAPKAARSAAPDPYMWAGTLGVSLQSERTAGAFSSVSSPEGGRRSCGCRVGCRVKVTVPGFRVPGVPGFRAPSAASRMRIGKRS